MTQAIIYGTLTCGWCQKTKDEFSERGITFDFVNIKELGKTAAEVTGRPVTTVPQIYLENEYIGGYSELMIHLNQQPESDECTACEG